MIPAPVRLFRPNGPDRSALVSTRLAPGGSDAYLIEVARGPRSRALAVAPGSAIGPVPEPEVEARFLAVVDGLGAEGFERAGLRLLIEALDDPKSVVRGRAAVRLGWLRAREAVPPLLSALTRAVDDVCPIVDALGAIGDPVAIPALRAQAARKLLSRRRSGAEAVRSLGDVEGLAEISARCREQLPGPVRAALDACEAAAAVADAEGAAPVVAAIEGLEPTHRGLAADTLYELGTPAASAAAVAFLLKAPFDRPFAWRYFKSVLKRAMLRHDPETFGRLVHAAEIRGRTSVGTEATVKSGYDGISRKAPIFRKATRDFVRRLGWRHLRNLARHRPGWYAPAAAEAIVAYGPDDVEEPSGLRGELAGCYLLHRILLGSSTRFVLDDRRLVFRFRDAESAAPPADRREEAYPDLWDAQPRAYLRVAASSRLAAAQEFAVRALSGRHRHVVESAPIGDVLRLVDAPFDATAGLGLVELRRRFDPAHPDWEILRGLLAGGRPDARALGREWLRATAPLWAIDEGRLLEFLTAADVANALLAAEVAAPHLGPDPLFRRRILGRLLGLLRAPEVRPGGHDAPAKLIREGLAAEFDQAVEIRDLVRLATTGTPAVQALAGDGLARRPGAYDTLGLEAVAALAEHEVAAVRAAAHAMIRAAIDRIRGEPSLLFLLAESDWDDNRRVAIDLLGDVARREDLGFDALMGLLDSNRPDVQDLGRSLVAGQFETISPRVLLERLVQHPHPNMRRFALDLVVGHLPDGEAALAPLSRFFRTVVLDLRPDRLLKLRIIDFLLARGLRDEYQAEFAARLLGEFIRLETRSDAEPALEALTRLTLAHPRAGAASGLAIVAGVSPS